MPRIGFKQSDAHKAKRAKRLTGRPLTAAHKERIAATMRKRPPRPTRPPGTGPRRRSRRRIVYRTKIVRVDPKQQVAVIPHPSLLALWERMKLHGCERIIPHPQSGGYAALFPLAKFDSVEKVEPAAKELWSMARKTPYGLSREGGTSPWVVTFFWTGM